MIHEKAFDYAKPTAVFDANKTMFSHPSKACSFCGFMVNYEKARQFAHAVFR